MASIGVEDANSAATTEATATSEFMVTMAISLWSPGLMVRMPWNWRWILPGMLRRKSVSVPSRAVTRSWDDRRARRTVWDWLPSSVIWRPAVVMWRGADTGVTRSSRGWKRVKTPIWRVSAGVGRGNKSRRVRALKKVACVRTSVCATWASAEGMEHFSAGPGGFCTGHAVDTDEQVETRCRSGRERDYVAVARFLSFVDAVSGAGHCIHEAQ